MAQATYMRGVNFVQLPTTILAQVDASSGGKTAIDHPTAKNLIGAFHQPRLVIVDPQTIDTLPERDFRSGLAEIVKHGIVLEQAYFEEVERDAAALLGRRLDVLGADHRRLVPPEGLGRSSATPRRRATSATP